MKKIEKVVLPSLLLLIASLYLISFGNIGFGTLCFVGFVILLVTSVTKYLERVLQSWVWVTILLVLSVALILYGPLLFAAEARIIILACVGAGFINFCLAVMCMILAVARSSTKVHGVNQIVAVVGIGVFSLGSCIGFYFFPDMSLVLGGLAISLVILGSWIWQKGDDETLCRFKSGILYPCLCILLLVGGYRFSVFVRQVIAAPGASQNFEHSSGEEKR